MTFDKLYENVIHYVHLPLDDKRKACLVLSAFADFLLDCADEGVDPRTLDMIRFVEEQLKIMGETK